MSPERDQDYLCEGLAEELIDALTHVEGLRVAARTSSFQFRGDHDLREVGRKLGVGSLLEGSVRKAGDRLRVTVQLIDVATGFHKWSEKFERSAGDVFAMQDEIAEKVATLLRGGELNDARTPRRAPPAHRHRDLRMFPARPPAHAHHAAAAHGRGRGVVTSAPSRSTPNTRPPGRPRDAACAAVRVVGLERRGPARARIAPAASRWNWRRNSPTRTSRAATRCRTCAATTKRSRISKPRRASIPNLFDAYYYYGRAAFAAGDIEKSIELWRKAAEVRREDFESPLLRGAVAAQARPHGRSARASIARRYGAPSGCSSSIRRMRRALSLVAGALLRRWPDRARARMGAARRSSSTPTTWA